MLVNKHQKQLQTIIKKQILKPIYRFGWDIQKTVNVVLFLLIVIVSILWLILLNTVTILKAMRNFDKFKFVIS